MYEPPGTGISTLVSVKEHYYEDLCWNGSINYTQSQVEQSVSSNIQSLVIAENISGFNSNPQTYTLHSETYFDPDFVHTDGVTKDPSFFTKVRAYSSQSHLFYFDKVKLSNLQTIKNGFINMSRGHEKSTADCSNPQTGTNTLGVCFDLTDKTQQKDSTTYEARNQDHSIIEVWNEQQDLDLGPVIMTDDDDRWNDDSFKQQTTELLVNNDLFDTYLIEELGVGSYLQLTGNKLRSAVNIDLNTDADPQDDVNSAYFDQVTFMTKFPDAGFEDDNGYHATWSRDVAMVAHEATHGIFQTFFGLSTGEEEKQVCAINEAFSDIIGSGAKRHSTGIYQPNFAAGMFDQPTPRPEGLRNFADPALSGGESVYIGNNADIPGDCGGPPDTEPPSCDNWPISDGECPYNWEGYSVISIHKIGNIITHLFHLMVTGGFNADETFRPDSFGVSPDEVFGNKEIERMFYSALAEGTNEGHTMKFCELRDRTLSAVSMNRYRQTAVQQAWKHVYKDIKTICPVPDNVSFLESDIEIKDGTVVLTDGELVDLGSTGFGQTLTKSLAITNTGEYPLRLINPEFSGNFFSQNLLGSSQVVVGVSETVLMEVSFTADATAAGLNQSSLTFETNIPNGNEDQHFFTIHLRGVATQPQGNADAFEDDDSVSTMKVFDRAITTVQQRNFEDDGEDFVDWKGLGGISDSTCYMEFSNFGTNVDICVDRFREIGGFPAGTFCGINDSSQNNEVSLWSNQWKTYFRIRNVLGDSTDSNYSISIVCPPIGP